MTNANDNLPDNAWPPAMPSLGTRDCVIIDGIYYAVAEANRRRLFLKPVGLDVFVRFSAAKCASLYREERLEIRLGFFRDNDPEPSLNDFAAFPAPGKGESK